MPRRSESRLYTRQRIPGGPVRYYADLRDFGDVGGGREALVDPEADTQEAVTDEVLAQELLARRLRELQERRRNKVLLGVKRQDTLAEYAARHLREKADEGQVSAGWLRETEHHLQACLDFFDEIRTPDAAAAIDVDPELADELGADRELATIRPSHVKAYLRWLGRRKSARGGRLAPGTRRHYLNALGNLFQGAIEAELYRAANPVHAIRSKPVGDAEEAEWLEVWEGALLLESARAYPYHQPPETVADRLGASIEAHFGPGAAGVTAFASRMQGLGKLTSPAKVLAYLEGSTAPGGTYLAAAAEVLGVEPMWLRRGNGLTGPARPDPIIYPLLATWLLTGGRESEVTGLEVEDVSFRRGTISFRENDLRPTLKTRKSRRTVPLWPQLREILEVYLDEAGPRLNRLLFPSPRLLEREGREGRIRDSRKALDAISGRVGWKPGEIRTKVFRHTYISSRLQTLDGGRPIQPWTVAQEVGHSDLRLVNEIYGHLQQHRHRSDVVEYRIEQHQELLEVRERLRHLRVA